MLFAGLALHSVAARAEETSEPRPINTSAAPTQNESYDVPLLKRTSRAPKIHPILPSDPIYEVVRVLHESDAAGLTSNAAPMLRGEAPAAKPAEWHVPYEESTPITRPPAGPIPGGSDPENARITAEGDDSERPLLTQSPRRANPMGRGKKVSEIVQVPIKLRDADTLGAPRIPQTTERSEPETVAATPRLPFRPAVKKFAPTDPEIGRFMDFGEGSEKQFAKQLVELLPADSSLTKSALRDELPRIESGSALDRDDPKPPALIRPVIPEKAPEEKVVAAPASEPATDGNDNAVAESIMSGKMSSARKLSSQPSTALAGRSNSTAKSSSQTNGKSVDPEERTAQLLQEILEKQKQYAELLRDANKRLAPTVESKVGTLIRGDHEKNVFTTLTAQNRPLGAIAVKIFNAKTKELLPCRVRLVDTTEAAARAPLATGFWCRGATPGINVVSGIVRAEIQHGGRFWGKFVKGLQVQPGKILSLEVPMSQPPQLDFSKHGWILADLDIGIRKQPGESSTWFGAPPSMNDLILGAKAEGVRIVGVSLPLGDETAMNLVRSALENPNPDVLLLPVFPGPRNLFQGAGFGLGVTSWDGLKATMAMPEAPLRDGFEAIRSRGGLAVFKDLNGTRTASIENEILPYYRRLKDNNFFNGTNASQAHLFGAAEFPFDTVTSAYDVLAFDGTDSMETVWFNLLNENAPVRVIGAGGGSLEGGRIPFGQTFLQMEGKPTREKVLQSITEGKSMVSFGPAVFCKVYERDMGPGSVLPTDGRQLHFQIRAFSTQAQGAQLEKIEIIRNGKVVYSQSMAEGEAEIQDLRWPISETANAWYVVRVTERQGHETDRSSFKYSRAWTSPIFFRNAAAAPFEPSVSHIQGTLRKGLTPVRGVVTALATGMPTQRVESGPDGSFSIILPSTGTLIFEAPDCEPIAKRVFEHPKVQNGLGRLLAADDILKKLADRPVFGLCRRLLSDLDWDITLSPSTQPPEPAQLPEAQ